ncbi:MAG: ABC transporter substrate-binding protein [Deltaproteobacteria bacterium]|nr:ABC transporter substrate-binding protein [Deltaproteobacteria bacterium]
MKKLFVLSFLIIFVAGCAAGTVARKAPTYPNQETPEAKAFFNRGYDLYMGGRFSEADPVLSQFITQFPYTELTDKARFYRGEIAFSKEDYDSAINFYRQSFSQIQSPNIAPMARFKAALAMYRLGRNDAALMQIKSVNRKAASAILRLRVDSLGVIASKAAKKDLKEYVIWDLYVLDDYSAGAGFKAMSVPAGEIIKEDVALNDVRTWVADETLALADVQILPLKEIKGKRSGGYANYKYAYLLLRAGNTAEATKQLKAYLGSYPKHEYYGAARVLMAELGGEIGVGAGVTVGVILPLSGRYAVYGKSVLHGVECALGIYAPCTGPAGMSMIVKDSAGGVSAASLVDQLVSEGVAAIIGPLLSKAADDAARRAQQVGVPLISLSQRATLPLIGNYIFRNYVTPESEISTLVDYVFSDRRSLRRFFILYPDNKKGAEYKDLFTEAVEGWGGKVVGSTSYAPNQMEFGGALRGRGRGATEQTAGIMFESPNFDALFIPDSFNTVGYIVPTLALMGIKNKQLLGISRWNDAKLVERGGEFVDDAIFVDAFFKNATNSSVASFVSKFKGAYGIDPTLLEASGYDSMRLIIAAIQQNGAQNRDTIRDALLRIVNFPGVAGRISFDKNGDARRQLYVLTVKDGEIRQIR